MQAQDKNRGKKGHSVGSIKINTETRNLKRYRARMLNQDDINFLQRSK